MYCLLPCLPWASPVISFSWVSVSCPLSPAGSLLPRIHHGVNLLAPSASHPSWWFRILVNFNILPSPHPWVIAFLSGSHFHGTKAHLQHNFSGFSSAGYFAKITMIFFGWRQLIQNVLWKQFYYILGSADPSSLQGEDTEVRVFGRWKNPLSTTWLFSKLHSQGDICRRRWIIMLLLSSPLFVWEEGSWSSESPGMEAEGRGIRRTPLFDLFTLKNS